MINIKNVHSSPIKVSDHIWNIRDKIIQAIIKVAYDQSHDQKSISHRQRHSVSTKRIKKVQPKAREIKGKTLSLEAYDLYIFIPLLQKVTKKFEKWLLEVALKL